MQEDCEQPITLTVLLPHTTEETLKTEPTLSETTRVAIRDMSTQTAKFPGDEPGSQE